MEKSRQILKSILNSWPMMRLARWGRTVRNNSVVKWFLVVSGSLLIGSIAGPFFQAKSEQWLKSKRIYCRFSDLLLCSKTELTRLAEELRLPSFRLSMDDSLLTNYYVARLQLLVGNVPIDDPLRLRFSTGTPHSKILDVRHRIIAPQHKELEMIHSLPELAWVWRTNFQTTAKFELEAEGKAAGFVLYRSLLPDRGFGRANPRLITNMAFLINEFPRRELYPSYYRIKAVVYGNESAPYTTIPLPNTIPLTLSSPHRATDATNSDNALGMNKSLAEASITSGLSAVDISFPAGLDSKSECELFLVLKSLPGSTLTPTIELIGAPAVRFEVQRRPTPVALGPAISFERERTAITPREVTATVTDKGILLSWDLSSNSEYLGAQIFRSDLRETGDYAELGKEIYSGPGMTNQLAIQFFAIDWPLVDSDAPSLPAEAYTLLSPPSPPSFILTQQVVELPPPTNLRASQHSIVVGLDNARHFLDTNSLLGASYTYTFYSYDQKRASSVPVVVNITFGPPFGEFVD